MHVRSCFGSSCLFQQTKVFIPPGNSCCPQVIPDNCYGEFGVGRNDDWPRNPRFDIGTMASLLPGKLIASGKEHFFKNRPVYWRYAWHLDSDIDNRRMSFNSYPWRTHPTALPSFIPSFFENFF